MDKKQDLINEIFKFVTLLENSGDFIFSQVGLTVKNYQILYLISTGLDTSKSLLGWSYGSKPNMAKKLRFLEDNNFVIRTIDLVDKRVFRFTLTKKWNKAMETVAPLYEHAVRGIFEGINDTDMQVCQSLIEKCMKNLSTHCPL
jgi:DNA-binding MarR family transcriptional regulator